MMVVAVMVVTVMTPAFFLTIEAAEVGWGSLSVAFRHCESQHRGACEDGTSKGEVHGESGFSAEGELARCSSLEQTESEGE